MEAVRYALQAVLPVALLLVLGWLLRKRNMVSQHFAAEGDHLCMRLLFPVLLFRSISQGAAPTRSSSSRKLCEKSIIGAIFACSAWSANSEVVFICRSVNVPILRVSLF